MGFVDVSDLAYKLPGGRVLFSDVTFKVHAGQHAALVGANGAGKTTLLRVLAGDEQAMRGGVRIDGRALYMRRRRSPGKEAFDTFMSPQEPESGSGQRSAANRRSMCTRS